jgi:hypothetical protein
VRADDQAAREVLAFLADMQTRVDTLWRELRPRWPTEAAPPELGSDVECRRYENGVMLSIWLEAPVDDGRTLTWWMDIVPKDDGWLLDARLSWNGRDIIERLPERLVEDFRAVQREAPTILQDLFSAGRRVFMSQ